MALERLTQITNSGITSGITITGVNLTGIVTATSANIGSGITLSGTQINVGSATTIHSSGFQIGSSDLHSTGISLNNINASGIVTATTFNGNLTGNVTGNATGLSGTPSITVATINASNATFSGNVSVAGTVTYEDVTNVDSVGIITARSGIVIGTGTSISSPVTNVLTLGTNNTEAIRINSSGNFGIGNNNPQNKLDVSGTGRISGDVYLTNGLQGSPGYVYLNSGAADSTDTYLKAGGTAGVWSAVQITGNWDGSSNTGGKVAFYTAGVERGRFDNAGRLGIGTANPQYPIHLFKTSYPELNMGTGTVTATYGIDTGTNTVVLGSTTNHPFSIVTAGSERARITAAGNFGLGTITPSKKLDIYGNSNTDFSQMGLIGVSNAENAPTLATLDNNTTTNYGTFQLTSLYAGDTHIRSYWGVSVDINDGGLGDSGSASQARIPSTSSFTVNSRSSSTAYRNLFAIRTSGLVVTPNNIGVGLDIGYKKSVSITGSFAANTWYNTGIDRTTDGGGVYLVSCYFDTYAAGGQSYQMRYVGWFVLPQQATNSGDATAITLHRSGHAPNSETLQLRTLLTPSADSRIYLQWLSNFNNSLDGTGGRNLQIVIHRFATPLGG